MYLFWLACREQFYALWTRKRKAEALCSQPANTLKAKSEFAET